MGDRIKYTEEEERQKAAAAKMIEEVQGKKTMTGLEALAYLNEKPGEHFVKATDDFCWTYYIDAKSTQLKSCGSGQVSGLGRWLTWQFTPCPDPSKPEVDEVEFEFAEHIDEMVGGKYEPEQDLSQSDLIRTLISFIEKHYVRKDEKEK